MSLLALGLVAPLLWLYLRRRPQNPVTVSSLRIWNRIDTPASTRKRWPLPPWLFWVQALLILVAALTLSGPYGETTLPQTTSPQTAVVLDVSASMQSKEGTRTRFEIAREAAQTRIEELAAENQRVTLIRAGHRPETLGRNLDAATAIELLDQEHARDISTNLAAAIEEALIPTEEGGAIEVFSDTSKRDVLLRPETRQRTRFHSFGRGGENVALANLFVEDGPLDQGAAKHIFVTARNYSGKSRSVVAHLTGTDDQARSQTARIPEGREHTFIFRDIAWEGSFQARLETRDDLAIDDLARGHISSTPRARILIVTEDPGLAEALEEVLARLGLHEVRSVTPRNYRFEDPPEILLLDRFVPAKAPSSNVAYLAPRRGNADVTTVALRSPPAVSKQEDHRLLRGIPDAKVLLDTNLIGLAPGIREAVLSGESRGQEVDLLQSNTSESRKVVASTFRLSAASLERADALPAVLFLLNLLSFLAPDSADGPQIVSTGARLQGILAPDETLFELFDPNGGLLTTLGDDPILDTSGIYLARTSRGPRQIFVNFADTRESDIARTRGATGDDPSTAIASKTVAKLTETGGTLTREPYRNGLLFVFAAVLLLEWLALALTPRRNPAATTRRST